MQDIDFLEVRNGKSFDQFFRRTKKEWNNLAYKVLSSVEHPAWIDVEDVTQYMAIRCMKAVNDWNPEKHHSIKAYVVFICCEYARHYLHHFRVSKGPERSGPARFDLPFCEFAPDDTGKGQAAAHIPEVLWDKLKFDANQERLVDLKRLVNTKNNFDIISAMSSGKNTAKMIQSKKHLSKSSYINKMYKQVCSL